MQQAKKQRVMYWLSFRGGFIMMKRKLTSLFLATAMVITKLLCIIVQEEHQQFPKNLL